jgi:hypothetical protein
MSTNPFLVIKSLTVGIACVLAALIILQLAFSFLVQRYKIFAVSFRPNGYIWLGLYLLLAFCIGFVWRYKFIGR